MTIVQVQIVYVCTENALIQIIFIVSFQRCCKLNSLHTLLLQTENLFRLTVHLEDVTSSIESLSLKSCEGKVYSMYIVAEYYFCARKFALKKIRAVFFFYAMKIF